MNKRHKEWEQYLSNPNILVMMDNDGWWFEWKVGEEPEGFDPDSDDAYFSGGDGPYGADLLEYMLERAGIEMEYV